MIADFLLALPHLNASLNATSFLLITSGLIAVRRGRVELHKKLMLTAVSVSALFLVSYLVYHFNVGSVKFQGQGAIRTVYFAVLISHTVLAVVTFPLVVTTVTLGIKDRRERHRKWARVTAPLWLYVSLSGVVVYVMLYQL